jgi:nitroreductase
MNATINLLLSRRSPPVTKLKDRGPTRGELDLILSAASRVPDHGKLVPWRFIIIAGEARYRIGKELSGIYSLNNPQASEERLRSEEIRLTYAPMIVVVIFRGRSNVTIPEWEQVLSSGAVAMNLIIAANALGFATCWLTGWIAYDPAVRNLFGLDTNEKIVGFVHIGSVDTSATPERARPQLSETVSWI